MDFSRRHSQGRSPVFPSHVKFWLRRTSLATLAILALVFAVMALRPTHEGSAVVVAKKDIDVGQDVSRADMRVIKVPGEAFVEGATSNPADFVGMTATQKVPRGTVLTSNALGIADQAARVEPGRARTVLALPASLVFVAPGDSVEVWGVPSSCEFAGCAVEILSGNVRVVEVSETDGGAFAGEASSLVTLDLPASDISEVLHAGREGDLHFVAR